MKLFTRRPTPIECQQVVEVVTAYLEDALPARERKRLEAHLAACPHCSAYLEQIRETIALSGRLSEDEIDPAARPALLRVFAAWRAGAHPA